MATASDSGSAKIFQFPPRGRFARSADRTELNVTQTLASLGVATLAAGSGWYHDEAIQDERLRTS
jgi:hypothetical protein